jgi:erythromycin esterase-like protein
MEGKSFKAFSKLGFFSRVPGLHVRPPPSTMSSTVELLRANVTPFSSIQENGDAIARYFDSFSDCKILLLGDASHGTSEFYAARAEITKYMIEHHDFKIVAVEADWPDAETVDRYVRYRPGVHLASVEPAGEAEKKGREPAFMRFPTWMWRNMEVRDFVEWLRRYNKDRGDELTGFYGLDVYSMSTSMREVIQYLEKVDEDAADVARERYGKLIPWADDPHEYGLEALMTGSKGYEKEVIAMLKDLLSKRLEYSSALWNGTEFHSGEQNARLVAGELWWMGETNLIH